MDQIKERIGETAATFVQDGMLVGLGTGSTARFFIQALARRHKEEGLSVATVSSSWESERLAKDYGLPYVSIDAVREIDCTFDGADEVTDDLDCIKGLGGALLKEKILAANSREFMLLVDETKRSKKLGTKAKLPIEVIQFGYHLVEEKLMHYAKSVELRHQSNKKPFVTESGHYILDVTFDKPPKNPAKLNQEILSIPGVVETGFFIEMASGIIIGNADGTVEIMR